MNSKTAYELETEAWKNFEDWCEKWRDEHPDEEEKTFYELAVLYGEEVG